MRHLMLLGLVAALLGACALTPEQAAWNREHHVGEMCWTCKPGEISTSPSHISDYDPHPHSDTDDAQRAAYQAHQQQQIDEAARSAEPAPAMHCTTTGSSSSGANAGMMSGSTSCHN